MGNGECSSDNNGVYDADVAVEYGYAESPGLQAGLERLGQIPNDLGIAGGSAAPASAAR